MSREDLPPPEPDRLILEHDGRETNQWATARLSSLDGRNSVRHSSVHVSPAKIDPANRLPPIAWNRASSAPFDNASRITPIDLSNEPHAMSLVNPFILSSTAVVDTAESSGAALPSNDKKGTGAVDLSQFSDWLIPLEEIQLGEHLGAGSFGEVRRGLWNGTEVAVKIFHMGSNSTALDEFQAEVLVMAKLRHPNIVPFMGLLLER